MKKYEFSKIILCLVMVTYFIGFIFGMFIIFKIRTDAAICGFFSYIGAPAAAAIGFYCYKAKAENIEKIRTGIVNEKISENIPHKEEEFK